MHRKEQDKRKAYKINALILLGSGWTYEQVSIALMLDISTLSRWVRSYTNGGLEQLCGNKYKGSSPRLSKMQQEELSEHLRTNLYLEAKKICFHIKTTYKIKYSISGVTKLLHHLGFVYKKPKVVPGKHDAQEQEKSIAEYKELKRSKHPEDPILFADGVHPQHNTMPAYGWIKKGEDQEIKSNTGRRRVNINGAIDKENQIGVFEFSDTIDASSTIKLFEKIERKYPHAKHIYIYCDNARYYHSKLVSDYLQQSKIILKFLPPYSPNLNLIERFWKFFKKNVLYNKYFETFDEFEVACRSFFSHSRSNLKKASSLLTDNFQRFVG